MKKGKNRPGSAGQTFRVLWIAVICILLLAGPGFLRPVVAAGRAEGVTETGDAAGEAGEKESKGRDHSENRGIPAARPSVNGRLHVEGG